MNKSTISSWHVNRAGEFLKQKLLAEENWSLNKFEEFTKEYLKLTDITDYGEWKLRLNNALYSQQVPVNVKKFVEDISSKVKKLQDTLDKEEQKKKEQADKQLKKRREEGNEIIHASTYEHEGILYEQCSQGCYVWYNYQTKEYGLTEYIEIKQYLTQNQKEVNAFTPYTVKKIFPNQGEELKREVVLLAEKPIPYGTITDLINEIKAYIHEWCDLPDQYEKFSAWYILLTWIYDQMPAIN